MFYELMASSDKSPEPTPPYGGEQPPGKPMTMKQHVLDKGAAMMQSLKPIKQMSQHVCTFALYSHDMPRQIETHHYVSRLNQDFLQCAVYDSDDSTARLIGNLFKNKIPTKPVINVSFSLILCIFILLLFYTSGMFYLLIYCE